MSKRKNQAAAAMGRKGGKARLKTLTPERRSEIARLGAMARNGMTKPPAAPKPGRWYGLVVMPTEPNPPKPGDKDFVGGSGAYIKMLDQAHAKPDVVLWSQSRDEVVARLRQEEIARHGQENWWTEIIEIDYAPTRFTIQREYRPNTERQLDALRSLLDPKVGQP